MLVTTLSRRLLDEYGRKTVASWRSVTARPTVLVVTDDEVETFVAVLGSSYRVLTFGTDSMECMQRIKAREAKIEHRSDDYRWQASRFAWKVFALAEVFEAFPAQRQVIWLDADSLIKDGFDDWLDRMVSGDDGVSYLGRAHKGIHAETGLISFVGEPGRRLFHRVADIYRSLELFEYREWHDGYIFNSVFQFNRQCFDICRHHGVRSSNPLHELDRGRHLVHLKGTRKHTSLPWIDDLRVLMRR